LLFVIEADLQRLGTGALLLLLLARGARNRHRDESGDKQAAR
jgi:hypothetical protein